MKMDYREAYDKKRQAQEVRNVENWIYFISYYRYYMDRFAEDVLGLRLYSFQRVILRAMGRFPSTMFVATRGIGKSFISGVALVCMAILYPEIKLGIVSGTGNQARMVIQHKIIEELMLNPIIEKEITSFSTNTADTHVRFANGSIIRAITLNQDRGGDSARGYRFNVLLIDEARLVTDKSLDDILRPMLRTVRANARIHNAVNIEQNKIIQITSAHLRTYSIYKRFVKAVNNMREGQNTFVCTLSYKVAIKAGLFREDDMESDKRKMSRDSFLYEYGAIFVGSSNDSYYPYELVEPTRTLTKPEFRQPVRSQSEYVITHDVALSGKSSADNACTHVIKLQPQADGTYRKDVVYTETAQGKKLSEQRDRLRELAHIHFPNTIKIVLDIKGNAQPLPEYFAEAWTYEDSKGVVREFPPLILDDDKDAERTIYGAKPMLRGIMGSTSYNHEMYSHMKSCFEEQSVRLLMPTLSEDGTKEQSSSAEVATQFLQADMLVQELNNIKSEETGNGNIVYSQISSSTRKDRVTALGYGLHYIRGLEIDNRRYLQFDNASEEDPLVYV